MKINGVQINFLDYGNKDLAPIVLLHGWGQNIEMMKCIGDKFINSNRVIIVDLPGHGKSSEPEESFEVVDFVNLIKQLLDNLNVSNPTLIGHSFGGKISLLYASKYDVCKLICLASPYKKQIESTSIKTKILKKLKKVPVLNNLEEFAKKHIGSADYKNASKVMREILVKTVNLDITENIKKIKCPTLLIWGTNDMAVPYEDALKLEKLIPNCGLVTYEGNTHYAYIERIDQTIKVLCSFMEVKI